MKDWQHSMHPAIRRPVAFVRPAPLERHCTRCEQWRPLDVFRRDRGSVCNPCVAAEQALRRYWRRSA